MERRPQWREEWWLAALQRGSGDGLVHDEAGALWCSRGGQLCEVGMYTEGVHVDFMLSCGRHLRRCTPNAVREPRNLMCRFCCPASALKRARRNCPSALERAVYRLLPALAPMQEWRWQFCPLLPRADLAPVDFYHVPSGTHLEVDGPQHFTSTMHDAPAPQQQNHDIRKTTALWAAGAALVRIHHADVAGGAAAVAEAAAWALHARACGYAGPLLVLTPTYAPDAAVARGRGSHAWWCLPELHAQLHGARPTTTPLGCTFFHQPPQLTM
jgi:hypothetical protein